MLELIILGQVPGTDLQLTFSLLLKVILAILCVIMLAATAKGSFSKHRRSSFYYSSSPGSGRILSP
jgi:hypothetical protein